MPAATYAIFLGSKTGIGTPVSLGTGGAASGASSVSLTTAVAIPAGSLVFVAVTGIKNSAISVSSISDGTNTYTLARTNTYSATTFVVEELWYCQNAAAVSAGATLTATFSTTSSNGDPTICAGYCLGVAASSSLDKVNSGDNNNTTSGASGTTGTLTQAVELVIGCTGGYSSVGAVTITESGSFTQLNQANSNTRYFTHIACQVVNVTTAINYQPTYNVSVSSAVNIATFKGS